MNLSDRSLEEPLVGYCSRHGAWPQCRHRGDLFTPHGGECEARECRRRNREEYRRRQLSSGSWTCDLCGTDLMTGTNAVRGHNRMHCRKGELIEICHPFDGRRDASPDEVGELRTAGYAPSDWQQEMDFSAEPFRG